jgi:hypothetical protein
MLYFRSMFALYPLHILAVFLEIDRFMNMETISERGQTACLLEHVSPSYAL